MRTEPPSAGADPTGELANPAYWLVLGLDWPADANADGGVAEAALAVAPGLIPRDLVSRDACEVLGCADLYSREYHERVVFFTDLPAMFTGAGTTWAGLGLDWQNALRELRDGPFPAMYLTITERAHRLICNPAAGLSVADPGAWTGESGGAERRVVRQLIATQLAADWPSWMNAVIKAGRIRHSGA